MLFALKRPPGVADALRGTRGHHDGQQAGETHAERGAVTLLSNTTSASEENG
jgi:hypothetical protein